VLGLLRAWVEDDSDSLKCAAAQVYSQVGLRYPLEAISQWRRILGSKKAQIELTPELSILIHNPFHMSVIDAIVSLFQRAVKFPHRLRPVFEPAIEGLADWVEADAKERGSVGMGLPLFLALAKIGYPPDDGSGDPDEWPPVMLYIVDTLPNSAYRRALAACCDARSTTPSMVCWALRCSSIGQQQRRYTSG